MAELRVQYDNFPASWEAHANAEELQLVYCTRVPQDISKLTQLTKLRIEDCWRLESLDAVSGLTSLQELMVWRCPALQQLPDGISKLQELQLLALADCRALQQLPPGTSQLQALTELRLRDCGLQQLPPSIGQLRALEVLYIAGCAKLQQLPPSIGQLRALKTLDVGQCAMLQQLPPGIGQLSSLRRLELFSCSSLTSLPPTVSGLAALTELVIRNCPNLEQLPDAVGMLPALETLRLQQLDRLQPPEHVLELLLATGKLQIVQLDERMQSQLPEDMRDLLDTLHEGAAARAGVGDRPVVNDTLGFMPLVKGTAQYLLEGDTKATTLAVYGNWGSGKSTFMKLVEAEMLLIKARQQMRVMPGMSQVLAQQSEPLSGWQPLRWLLVPIAAMAIMFFRVLLLPFWAVAAMCCCRGKHRPDEPIMWKLLRRFPGRCGVCLVRCLPLPWLKPVTVGAAQQLLQRKNEWQQQQQGVTPTAADVNLDALTASDWSRLRELASPHLLVVFFNSWQYLTSQEVWSGLVVEVTKQLEQRLSMKHRCSMLWCWWCHTWAPRRWLQLCCWPMALHAACAYNCRTRATQVWVRCVLPLLLVLALIVAGTVVGVTELVAQEQRLAAATSPRPGSPRPLPPLPANASEPTWTQQPGAVAAVLVMGIVGAIFAALVAGLKHCKDVSDSIESGRSYMRFKRHKDKLGYQAQVLKDLQLLGELLRDRLARFQQCTGEKDLRIVVFIDDLDRCKPSSIVEVLEAINVVLADSGISVVVGMDKDFVLSGIQNAYKDVKVMQSLPKAQEFLQKIVQAELTLPKLAHKDTGMYLKGQGVRLVITDPGTDPFTPPSQHPSFSSAGPTDHAEQANAAGRTAAAAGGAAGGAADRTAGGAAGGAAGAAGDAAGAAGDAAGAAADAADAAAADGAAGADQAAQAAEGDLQAATRSAHAAVVSAQEAVITANHSAQDALAYSRGQTASLRDATDAVRAAQEAGHQCQLAVEAGARASHATSWLEANVAAARASQAAKNAWAAANDAAEFCRAARATAAHKRPPLGIKASQLFGRLLHRRLLEGTTPRELKRLLNRFLLARLCCRQQVKLSELAGKTFSFDEQQLLAWVFLWWRFPLGMIEAFSKFNPKDQDAPTTLKELLELQWSSEAKKAPAGLLPNDAPTRSTKNRRDQKEPPTVQQLAAKQLEAAQESLQAAEAAADAAAADTSGSAADLKKAAQKKVTAASLQVAVCRLAAAQQSLKAAAAAVEAATAEAKQSAEANKKLAQKEVDKASWLVALCRLDAAQESQKEAEAAAEEAAADTSDNAAERRKLRQKQLDKADLKLELAKIAVLCCDEELHRFFNLPRQALEDFRPFGM